MRTRNLFVALSLLLTTGCAAGIPAHLACPDFAEPILDLASDAIPPALACAADPEPAAYLAMWKAELHAHWSPEHRDGIGTTAAIFSMDHSGAVGRFCIASEAQGRVRRSVVSALDSFEPSAVPSEAVAACVAGKRFRASFNLGTD